MDNSDENVQDNPREKNIKLCESNRESEMWESEEKLGGKKCSVKWLWQKLWNAGK